MRLGVVSLWGHLVADTYQDGIAWLWPLTEEKLGLFRKPPEIIDHGWQTPAPLSSEPGRVEAAMWIAFAAGTALHHR